MNHLQSFLKENMDQHPELKTDMIQGDIPTDINHDVMKDDSLLLFETDENEEKVDPWTEEYLIPYQLYKDDFFDSNIKLEPILSQENAQDTVLPIRYDKVWKN